MSIDNIDTWWRWLIVSVAIYGLMDWVTDNLFWIVQGREPLGKDGNVLKRGLFFDGCFPLPVAAALSVLLIAILGGKL